MTSIERRIDALEQQDGFATRVLVIWDENETEQQATARGRATTGFTGEYFRIIRVDWGHNCDRMP